MSFKKLEGETAIVATRGVFKQCDLYEWNGKLFAQHSGGYVRLKENGSTSKDGVQLIELQFDGELLKDRHGRLCTQPDEGRTLLSSTSGVLQLAGD